MRDPSIAFGVWTGALAAAAAMAALPAGASTYASLSNFDTVNDTGKPAYGFEIEIDDSSYDHVGTITSVFGYDRVFGFISPDPGAVVRFGSPTIQYIPGFGARITYGGSFGGASTPSGPYVANGDSCWPGSPALSLAASTAKTWSTRARPSCRSSTPTGSPSSPSRA